MNFTQIIDFKLGASVRGFFICKEKYLKLTKNGDLYLDIQLIDSTGSIHCKMWDLVSDFQHRFDVGSAVAVKGSVCEFNDSLQLIITNINIASKFQYSKYGFDEKSLIKFVSEPISSLWARLDKNSKLLKKPLFDLVNSILNNYKNKIQSISYSPDDKFPLKGGFLKSMVVNLDICLDLIKHYPLLDKEISIAGTILFRIGMVAATDNDLLPTYNDDGTFVGFPVLGRDILLHQSEKIKISSDIVRKLEYIILNSDLSRVNTSAIPEYLFIRSIYKLNDKMNRLNEL